MAVLPGFPEQRCVCNAIDRPGEEVFEGQPRALLCELLVEYSASKDRQHLHIQQCKGKYEGSRNEVSKLEAEWRAQEIFCSGGGIDHIADHVRSCSRCCRSCASSDAADTPRSVVGRWASRSCHSRRASSRSSAMSTTSLSVHLCS